MGLDPKVGRGIILNWSQSVCVFSFRTLITFVENKETVALILKGKKLSIRGFRVCD